MKPDRRSARQIRRITVQEITKAATGIQPNDDLAVHRVRKRLKKARAGLRLLRPTIGNRAYRRENAALRDAARPLTGVRDAKALVDTLDGLIKWAKPVAPALEQIRPSLVTRLRLSRQAIDTTTVTAVVRRLRRCAKRVNRMALPRGDHTGIKRGVRRVYRAGRRTLAKVQQTPTTLALHELRKQVKYLSNQLQMIEKGRNAQHRRYTVAASELAHVLGLDHDIAILLSRMKHSPGTLSAEYANSISAICVSRRALLQAQSMRLAHTLYAVRPRKFVKIAF